MLGIDLGTTAGVAKVYEDGSLDAFHVKSEASICGRCTTVAGIIERSAGPDCMGVCIEEPFSGQFSSVKALFPMLGAAVLRCEELKMPWSTVHLAKVKANATGHGNAKKDAMQAAAKARWGKELTEDEADASWIGAYGLDHAMFG